MKNPGKTEPKMLTLGDCRQCGGPVVISMQKGVPLSAYAGEEFCSSVCCRRFHGVVMASDPKEQKRVA